MNIENIKKFIELGYGNFYNAGMRSLDFKTEEIPFKNALEVIGIIPHYNNFKSELLIEVLKDLEDIIEFIIIGREGSVCIYLVLKRDTNDVEFERIKKKFFEIYATEIYVSNLGIRIWWD